MRKPLQILVAGMCLSLLSWAGGAFAAPIVFDLTQFGPMTPDPQASHNNHQAMEEEGLRVDITGWNLPNLTNGTFRQSQINFYDFGVGTCNPQEGLDRTPGPDDTCSTFSPIEHPIDNMNSTSGFDGFDFILFEFGAPVWLIEAEIDIWSGDSDVTWYSGAGDFPTLLGRTLAQANLGPASFDYGGAGDANFMRTVDLFNNRELVTWLLFGADTGLGRAFNDFDDAIKIRSLTVPIPSSLFVISGFIGLGIWGRMSRST